MAMDSIISNLFLPSFSKNFNDLITCHINNSYLYITLECFNADFKEKSVFLRYWFKNGGVDNYFALDCLNSR